MTGIHPLWNESLLRASKETVDLSAQELGYSPKYISSIIKQKTGAGFSEYLQKRTVIDFSVTDQWRAL